MLSGNAPIPNDSTQHSENAVSLKLPTFWTSQPQVWFEQVEAQFNLRQISADTPVLKGTLWQTGLIVRRPPGKRSLTSVQRLVQAVSQIDSEILVQEIRERLRELAGFATDRSLFSSVREYGQFTDTGGISASRHSPLQRPWHSTKKETQANREKEGGNESQRKMAEAIKGSAVVEHSSRCSLYLDRRSYVARGCFPLEKSRSTSAIMSPLTETKMSTSVKRGLL
ncbi:hypothetical protein M514_02376 [Trichuris suis]|uniref:DUF7041 domain-containing protein n=1 Tax=Trichuris suis TaxID=68888 RepID=A0A085MHK4_9BILA|nr:hypothetical protein M513_02376 [Trichuris suis]KFD66899.1 hypothetical protein M514_02376 [Trichuris suis]